MDDAELVARFDSDVLAYVIGLVHQRPAWHAKAACRGQGCGPWFPTRGETVSVARAFCAACPVADECSEAGRDEPAGIWAGDSARARHRGRTAA